MLYFYKMTQLAISSNIAHLTQPETIFDGCSSQLHIRASTPELSIEKLKEMYLESLTPKEHKSYLIARDHLGMSFTLEKSVGFLQWKKTRG